MNMAELKANKQLTEQIVQDLNHIPRLPFSDGTVDAITNVVSVDYLNKPVELMLEQRRVLKPGGLAICR